MVEREKELVSVRIPFSEILKKKTSYPLEPYGCIRHKTRSMELYYPTLMEESRGDFDNNGYIRS